MPQNEQQTDSVYEESEDEPGFYVYRSDLERTILDADAHAWNVEAVRKLDQMYERLGIPKKYRR